MSENLNKKNFWNNWDFKSILQIVLIVVGFIVAYTKLEARVDNNKIIQEKDIQNLKTSFDKDIEYIKQSLDEIKEQLKK